MNYPPSAPSAPASCAPNPHPSNYDPNFVVVAPQAPAGPQQQYMFPSEVPFDTPWLPFPASPHIGTYAPQPPLPYPYFQGDCGDWRCMEYPPAPGIPFGFVPLMSPNHGDASAMALNARTMSQQDCSIPGTANVAGAEVELRDPRACYTAYQDCFSRQYTQSASPNISRSTSSKRNSKNDVLTTPQQGYVEIPRESYQMGPTTYPAYQTRGGVNYQYFVPNHYPQYVSPRISRPISSTRNSKEHIPTTPNQGGVEVPRGNDQESVTISKEADMNAKKRPKKPRRKLGCDNTLETDVAPVIPQVSNSTNNSGAIIDDHHGKQSLNMPGLLTLGFDGHSTEGHVQTSMEAARNVSGLPSTNKNYSALDKNAANFSGVAYSRDFGDKVTEMFKEIFDTDECKNEAPLETASGTGFGQPVAVDNYSNQSNTMEEQQQQSSETATMSFSDGTSALYTFMSLEEAVTDQQQQQQQVYYLYTNKNTDGTTRLSILENPKDLSSTSESDQNLIILEGSPAATEPMIKESKEEPKCDATSRITSGAAEVNVTAPITTETQGITYQSRETFKETLDSNFMLDDFAADLAALSNDFPDFPLNLDEFFNEEQLLAEVTDDIDRQLEERSSIPDNKSSATPTREETTSSSKLYAPTDSVTETTGSVDVDITQHLWRAAAASSDAAESNISLPSPETGEVPLIGSEIEVRTSIIFSDSDDSCFSFTTSFNDEHNQESCSRMSGKTYVDASTNTSPSRAQKDVGVQTCASEKSKKTPKATQKGTPTSKRKAAAPKLHQELRGRNAEFDILITEMSRFAEQARANVGTGATPGTVEESPGEKDPQKPHASIVSATSIRIKPLKRLKEKSKVVKNSEVQITDSDDNLAKTSDKNKEKSTTCRCTKKPSKCAKKSASQPKNNKKNPPPVKSEDSGDFVHPKYDRNADEVPETTNINRDDNVAGTGSSVDSDAIEPQSSPPDTENTTTAKDFVQSFCSEDAAAAAVGCNRVEDIVSKTSVGVAALGEDGHRNDESHHETVEFTVQDASHDAIISFEDSEGSSKNLSGDKKDTNNNVAVVQGSVTAELPQAPSAEEEDTVQLPRRYNLRKRKN